MEGKTTIVYKKGINKVRKGKEYEIYSGIR